MDVIKLILWSTIVAGAIVYLNNRYRLPLIGLSSSEQKAMMDAAERQQAADAAAAAGMTG